MEPLEILAGAALFSGVTAGDLAPLLPALNTRRYRRGSYLFHEGDPGSQLFVVLAGQVRIARTLPDGDEAVLALLHAPDVFGELAVLDERSERTADALADTDVECLTLRREALLDFLEARPSLLRGLVVRLAAYVRYKDDMLAEVGFNDIPGRLAGKLLELAERHGRPVEGGVRIEATLTQRTLAGMVAASRENVNRALARFAAGGALRVEGSTITILRPEALRRRGGGLRSG